jgi:hypothetical protein
MSRVRSPRSHLAALAAVAGFVLAASAAPAAAGPSRVGGQFRYWDFSNGNDMRDPLVYWATPRFHVQIELWDFQRGDDQFRPEVGWHLRDARRSVYTLQWRHENLQERYTVATDQVLTRSVVGRLELSSVVGGGNIAWVPGAGLDYYWGSYNFVQATLIHDPRGSGLWSFPLRLRLATESNDWLQLTLAPASARTVGWAVDAKWRWLRVGVERNSRYDFTTLDNIIYTIGFELELPPPE